MPVLPDLLRALLPNLHAGQAGDGAQTLSVTYCAVNKERILVLTRTRTEFSEGIAKAAATIVLDATERTEDILSRLDLHHAHTEVIEAEAIPNGTGQNAEVKLFQVPCLGGLGRYRKPEKTEQRNQLVDAWARDQQQRRGLCPKDLAVLDHKPFCRKEMAYEQPWLTLVARGGNYFEKCRALLMIGLPIQNLISQATDYELLSATSLLEMPELEQWNGHRVAVELIQGIGRLRITRRAGDFEIWFANDANLAPLCDQQGWERPTIVESTGLIGQSAKQTAQATALKKVTDVITAMKTDGKQKPSSASFLCMKAGISRKTFNRACKAGNTNLLKIVNDAWAA